LPRRDARKPQQPVRDREITGGAGNNTLVVNDLDRSIRVGNTTLSVIDWRGRAILDNAANDSAYPEHYLSRSRPSSRAVVDIRSTGTDGSDRLVVTGSDAADRFLLTATGPSSNATATIQLAREIRPARPPVRRHAWCCTRASRTSRSTAAAATTVLR
jgi:hypothetical protein